jgi:RNA polymerase sigma-70 factor (ECF subfamily)
MSTANGSLDVRSLVDQHYQMLYRYAYRLSGSGALADDLTQETFCTAQQKIGQLRDPSSARGWLFKILRNHYLGMRRHETVAWMRSLESLPMEPEQIADRSPEIDGERLQQVLGDLPESFRTPVILFYFEDFSYRQIAEQMGVAIGTVMSRLARAKAYLRSRLQSDNASRHTPASPGVT